MTVSILCTNDLGGAWDPTPASFGVLPGARGLRQAVHDLKTAGPAIWADAGDLVDGGVLATDRAELAWQAAAQLGIDVAVPGNHEFDWGTAHFRAQAAATGLPYICANADLGLPPTRIIGTAGGTVGFIGLTHPGLNDLSPGLLAEPQPLASELVPALARGLRADGCDHVVAVVHDGVTSPLPPDATVSDPRLAFLRGWSHAVDAVIGGHTLWSASVLVDGFPLCQPEPFGAELGIIRLGGRDGPAVGSARPQPAGAWDGAGAAVLARARDHLLATARTPISAVLGEDHGLLHRLAGTLRDLTRADAALVSLWDCFCVQPIRDGVVAHVPAGPFSRADLLRRSPEADEQVTVATITAAEFGSLRHHLWIPFLPALGMAGTEPSPLGTVAITGRQARHSAAWLTASQPATRMYRLPLTFTDVWRETLNSL
jgi:hypothetical protein